MRGSANGRGWFVLIATILLVAVGAYAVPPTQAKLNEILTRAIGVTEMEIRTNAATTTPEIAFTTDLTAGNGTTIPSQRTDATTQQATIRNDDTANMLCFKGISWASSGGSTCQLKCAAATITCSGASTDGIHISAGSTTPLRYDGTNCVCVVSAATGAYQTTRVIR